MSPTDVPSVPTEAAPLPSGAAMPLLGFGTWQLTGQDAYRCTLAALKAGYRHIDTAKVYGNETEVGDAIRDSGVARAELFITTKVPPATSDEATTALQESLDKLQTDYLDLWLIHWPGDDAGLDQWEVFTAAKRNGQVRDIGVSNYSLELIDEVAASGEAPAVNQIRWSPLIYDREIAAGLQQRRVVLEGYSALRGGTLDNPTIADLAERIGRTVAQVILRWHLQHGFVAIPKSSVEERIVSNADVGAFELSAEDMAALDSLASG